MNSWSHTMDSRVCTKHGESMTRRKPSGWVCRQCGAEANRRWRATPHGSAAMEEANKRRKERPGYQDKANAAARRLHGKRKRFLQEVKLQSGCVDCGYCKNVDGLAFDHVPERGPKLFNPSRNTSISRARLLRELAKCDVVCGTCHLIRTAARRQVTGDEIHAMLERAA